MWVKVLKHSVEPWKESTNLWPGQVNIIFLPCLLTEKMTERICAVRWLTWTFYSLNWVICKSMSVFAFEQSYFTKTCSYFQILHIFKSVFVVFYEIVLKRKYAEIRLQKNMPSYLYLRIRLSTLMYIIIIFIGKTGRGVTFMALWSLFIRP